MSKDCPCGITPENWYLIIVAVAAIFIITLTVLIGTIAQSHSSSNTRVYSAAVSNVILPVRVEGEVEATASETMQRLNFGGGVKKTDYNFGTGKWTVLYEAETKEGIKDIEVRIDDRTMQIEKIYILLMLPGLREGKINLEGQPTLGDENAKLEIVEFGDLDYSYSKEYYEQIFPKIKEEYIDTGKVKYVFINYPLTSLHARSQRAAEASECAHEQNKFWEYRKAIHEKWDPTKTQNGLSDEDLKQLALDSGLNLEEFEACLDSGKMITKVQNDYKESIKAGATVAPAFYIGNSLVGGVQSFEMFNQIIDYGLNS